MTPSHGASRMLVAALFTALSQGLGCGPQAATHDGSIASGSPDRAGAWLYWPTTLRIHPLSSVRRDEQNERRIEVRIDCRDRTGASTKAVGTFVVILDSEGTEPPTQRWTIPVSTISEHTAQYDAVTGLYRIDVTPHWTRGPVPGSSGTIRVILHGADGARIEATHRIIW